MVCGYRSRRLQHLLRGGALVGFGALALACSSIGLTSSMASDTANDNTINFHDADAGTDASTHSGNPSTSDAAAPIGWTSSPLCNILIQNEAGVPCNPDYPASPSGDACKTPDAGASYGDGDDGGGHGDASADGGVVLSCHVVSVNDTRTQACGIGGPGVDGDSCQTGADCAPAFECVGMPGRCRRYCCEGDTSCAQPNDAFFCDIQATAESNLKVPVCSPVSKCKLLTPNACATGETCAVVKDDGTTGCVTIGPAQAGEPCDMNHCDNGLTCLGKPGSRQCFKLCRVAYPGDCDSNRSCVGSVQLFNDPDYGICQ
jgi:hypothetical protein